MSEPLHATVRDVLATGEALLAALDGGHIEEAALLTARRAALVGTLPPGGSACLSPDLTKALVVQEEALAEAVAAARRRVEEALEAHRRRRHAVLAYHEPDPGASFLRDVQG